MTVEIIMTKILYVPIILIYPVTLKFNLYFIIFYTVKMTNPIIITVFVSNTFSNLFCVMKRTKMKEIQ